MTTLLTVVAASCFVGMALALGVALRLSKRLQRVEGENRLLRALLIADLFPTPEELEPPGWVNGEQDQGFHWPRPT
jgi:hypothetical protein